MPQNVNVVEVKLILSTYIRNIQCAIINSITILSVVRSLSQLDINTSVSEADRVELHSGLSRTVCSLLCSR